jgi:hypothetical protein
MAGSAGRNGVSQKAYYAAYKGRAESNRKARQEKHMKKHPNDAQSGSNGYRKSAPQVVSGWLTVKMSSLLTPVQVSPATTKSKGGATHTGIPECAGQLKEMKNGERKTFAQLYARIRKLHQHNSNYGTPKSK